MPGHYFSPNPSVAPKEAHARLHLADLDLELVTSSGVFSGARVDAGTLALLRCCPPPPASGHLVDIGCGYGPIACALAKRAPGATVWAVDVNERAVELTARNAERLGLPNVKAVLPDQVPAGLEFAGAWSNPPIRIGKDALHQLLELWLARLAGPASAWLVVHHHLGSDSLASWLSERGWEVRRVASKAGYRVLQVTAGGGA